jgi:4-aminobutyrate aminotransferase-like enzyme
MKILAKALQEGAYCMPGMASVIVLASPLTINRNEIDHAMGVFDKALSIADAETVQ